MIKKNNKIVITTLYALLALPIPLSLISWIGTIMQIASFGMIDFSNISNFLLAVVALITMILAGTYPITYIFSLKKTNKNKEINLTVLLPIAHIILVVVLLNIWDVLEKSLSCV